MASLISGIALLLAVLLNISGTCHGNLLYVLSYPYNYDVAPSYGSNYGPDYGPDYGQDYGAAAYPLDYSGMPPMPPPSQQLTNHATGNVINTGSAQQGSLAANGQSNTQTGPQGSLSQGHGGIGGSGLGIQGVSVNSAGSGGGSALYPSLNMMMLPGGGGPGGSNPFGNTASSSAMFLNSLSALKGTVGGTSDTMSGTGPNGNSYGSSSGNAMGQGQGIQLTQVANSDSAGSAMMPMPQWM